MNAIIRLILLCFCFFSFTQITSAQLSWNTTSTGSLQLDVCYQEDTVQVAFSNISGALMDSDSLVLQLPPGVFYISGSIVETTAFTVTENVTSTANRMVLVLKDLPAIGGTVNFSFRIKASCAAITHFEAGGSFQNNYTFFHDGIAEPIHTTPDFNINYPALSISNVTNPNVNTSLGATYTQQLTITNGGNSPLSNFFIALNPPSGMLFTAPNIGQMNASNDTIFFANNALGSDSLFTGNENIIVQYQITINNCTDLSTDLHLIWGCDNAFCQTDIYPIAASVPSVAPILSTVATPSGVQCFGEPNLQQVRVINTGTGISINGIFEIFAGNANGNPATTPNRTFPIDTSSIMIQSGTTGTPISISPFFTQNGSGSFTSLCGVNNRIGRARITLPNMAVGDTVIISWTQMACCSQFCNQGLTFNAWEYKADYQNECQTETYSSNYIRGSVRSYDHISSYSSVPSGPTDINDGDTSNFILEFTNSNGLTVPATDGWLEIEIPLPLGVTFSGNFTLFNRLFTCSRTPDSLIVVNDTIKAFFNFTTMVGCIGSNGSANKAEVHVGLVADCSIPGAVSGPLSIPVSTYLNLYPNCPTQCRKPMYCQTWNTDLHCLEPCLAGGLQFSDFSVQRYNLGPADNDNNGIADAAGSLDLSIIRSKTVIAGDTLQLRYQATVATSVTNPQFEFAYLDTRMLGMAPNGRNLDALFTNIQVFDFNTGLTYTCNNSTIITNSTNNFSLDINACTPAGFVFEAGDSIAIEAFYRFTTKFSGSVLTHDIENDFYLSRIANPVDSADKYACNTLGNQFKTIGFYHTTCCGSSRNMNSCGSVQISKNYYLSIGPCCSNYANGNYFRNEIRHFSYLDTFEFLLPAGFEMDSTQVADFRYVYTGGSVGYTAITPIDPASNPVRFVIGDFFTPRGGSHPISDEGYYGTVRMFIKPSCNATPSSRVYYYGHYQDINSSSTFFDDYRGTSDLITYTGPDLDLATITPISVSTTDTAVWQFRLDNNSNLTASSNTFFNLSSAAGGIVIAEVRDVNNNTVLTANANGIYELGVLNPSTNNVYEIIATQNSCVPDSLLILAGWNCENYPTDIASYPCPFDSSYLKVTNPQSALQVAVLRDTSSGVDSVDMCSPLMYEIELTSSQASSVNEIFATLQNIPFGLSFMSGSVEFEYPLGSGYQAGLDPTAIGSNLEFDVSNYAPGLNNKGLLGTGDADSLGQRKVKVRFQLETDCNFITGEAFNVQIRSQRPCGDPLPNIVYTVAPILIKGTDATPYVTQIRMSADEITACGDKHAYFYNVSIRNLGAGTTAANDSILIRLPAGILFQGYTPSTASFSNPPLGQPTVTNNIGGTDLSWPMVGGIVPGDSIVFSVRIDAEDDPAICASQVSQVFSLINTSIFCLSSGTNCITSTPSGRNNANIVVNRPSLTVSLNQNVSHNFQLPSAQNAITINGTIDNSSTPVLVGDTLTVEFFCDHDASGDFTTGDTYIGFYSMDIGLATGASHAFTWMDTFNVALCDVNGGENIVAALRAQPNVMPRQCACQYSQRLFQDILLPVDLVSFNAQVDPVSCAMHLHWETMAEDNLDYYEVERSLDGFVFESLDKVPAIGTSRISQHYSWLDNNIHEGYYYYRLKIVELGGNSRYSDLIYAFAPCAASQGKHGILALYPNPTPNLLHLKFYSNVSQNTKVRLQILDVLGRPVHTKEQVIVPGTQIIKVDVNHLPEGTYSIELQNKTWSSNKKFIKTK
jgi:hypothetical protein